LQAKLLLGERIIYLIAPGVPSRSLGEIYVPKQELGNEGKTVYLGARCASYRNLEL
jgi:hypothetical protein